jgi:hypothetical protein
MTLSASPTFIVAARGRRALDVLSRQGREDMLDLIWAAWFASRPERTRQLLVRTMDDGPEAAAMLATAEATMRLRRLRSAAAGDLEVTAIVDGLLEGERTMRVPSRLRRVLDASDEDRGRALNRVRAETAVRVPRRSAEAISAVIGYLVGTELDGDGTAEGDGAAVREVPVARGFCRSAMSSLGLPFDTYMERMRTWL